MAKNIPPTNPATRGSIQLVQKTSADTSQSDRQKRWPEKQPNYANIRQPPQAPDPAVKKANAESLTPTRPPPQAPETYVPKPPTEATTSQLRRKPPDTRAAVAHDGRVPSQANRANE